MYNLIKSLHMCNIKEVNMCDKFDDDDDGYDEDGIVVTDREEEIAKENNPILKKYNETVDDNDDNICLVEVLLTALDNEFDKLHEDTIIRYLFILKKHLKNHNKSLEELIREINLPDNSKLIHIAFTKFRD